MVWTKPEFTVVAVTLDRTTGRSAEEAGQDAHTGGSSRSLAPMPLAWQKRAAFHSLVAKLR